MGRKIVGTVPRRASRTTFGSIVDTSHAYDRGMNALSGIIREALIVAAVLCFPVLVVATMVGTAVAVMQAATQVQEQTLTLLPKMIAVALMLAFFGGFGLSLCGALFAQAIAGVPEIVRGS